MPKIPSLSADEMRTLRGTAEAAQRARAGAMPGRGAPGTPRASMTPPPQGVNPAMTPRRGPVPGGVPGMSRGMKGGGSVSARADGVVSKGKTKGRFV